MSKMKLSNLQTQNWVTKVVKGSDHPRRREAWVLMGEKGGR